MRDKSSKDYSRPNPCNEMRDNSRTSGKIPTLVLAKNQNWQKPNEMSEKSRPSYYQQKQSSEIIEQSRTTGKCHTMASETNQNSRIHEKQTNPESLTRHSETKTKIFHPISTHHPILRITLEVWS